MVRRGRRQFDKTGCIHFITTTVTGFEKVFVNDRYYDILLDNLRFYLNKYNSTLFGFVFMPNHIHLIVFIREGKSVSDFMRDFKKYTSVKIKELQIADGKNDILRKLTKSNGDGYSLWMDRFDSIPVQSDHILTTKLDYVHFNPVKAGLAKEMTDWKYSSARNYYNDDQSLIYVSTDWSV